MKNQSKISPKLEKICLHTIICGSLLVLALMMSYLSLCLNDGFLSQTEIKNVMEYFFICITEILFLSLSFDLIYKWEKARE